MLPPPDYTASIGAEFLCLAVLFLLDLGSALQTKAYGTAVSFLCTCKIMAFTVGFDRIDGCTTWSLHGHPHECKYMPQ